MADKMMRQAGRTSDGYARAIKVDNLGRTEVVNSTNRKVFDRLSLNAGTSSESQMINNEGSTSARTVITSSNPVTLKVTKNEYRHTGADYVKIGEEIIYEAVEGKHVHVFEYILSTEEYTLTVENASSIGTNLTAIEYIGSSINVGVQKVDLIDNREVINFFNERQSGFDAGVAFETEIFPSGNDDYAVANIILLNDRRIRVSIQYYYLHPSTQEFRGDGYTTIYEATERLFQHNVGYYLKSEYYSLRFENIDTLGASISELSSEKRIKLNTPIQQNVKSKEIEKLLEQMSNYMKQSVNVKKAPNTQLFFKESAIRGIVCIGYDGKFYGISDGKLSKYNDIKTDTEPAETGITWDSSTLGNAVNLMFLQEGFVVFSNYEDVARIYHLDDINDDPELVYESDNDGSYWASRNAFGMKSYSSGLNSYVLAGVYGRGDTERDLLLSNDGGKTFEVIKKTRNIELNGRNSHWHDVAIDTYHGFIWAAQGDGEQNRAVYFSDDWGDTWRTLEPRKFTQPTAIIPFPEKVVFGRDDGRPGLYYFDKPMVESDYDNFEDSFKTLRDFKVDAQGFNYYGKSPIVRGNEAYLSFTTVNEKPNMLMGTGDFGETWHFLFIGTGESADGNVSTGLIGMDDEYIYSYGSPLNGQSIIYAKKPEWISV